jgi:hypothetical protein
MRQIARVVATLIALGLSVLTIAPAAVARNTSASVVRYHAEREPRFVTRQAERRLAWEHRERHEQRLAASRRAAGK